MTSEWILFVRESFFISYSPKNLERVDIITLLLLLLLLILLIKRDQQKEEQLLIVERLLFL